MRHGVIGDVVIEVPCFGIVFGLIIGWVHLGELPVSGEVGSRLHVDARAILVFVVGEPPVGLFT